MTIIESLMKKNIPFAVVESRVQTSDGTGIVPSSELDYYLVIHRNDRSKVSSTPFFLDDSYSDLYGKSLQGLDKQSYLQNINNFSLVKNKHGKVYEFQSFKKYYHSRLEKSELLNLKIA